MASEYTFPDPDHQKKKNELKESLMAQETPKERQTVFMAYLMDMSYPRPVIHQALKECRLNDDFTFKEETSEAAQDVSRTDG